MYNYFVKLTFNVLFILDILVKDYY